MKRFKLRHFPIRDRKTAEDIIKRTVTNQSDRLIVSDSGDLSQLTTAILSQNVKTACIYEKDKNAASSLEKLLNKKAPHRDIKAFNRDLLGNLFRLTDDKALQVCREAVKDVCGEQYFEVLSRRKDVAPVKILLPLMSRTACTRLPPVLYHQLALRVGFSADLYVQYYLLMTNRFFNLLSAKPNSNLNLYRTMSVIFNSIFYMTHLNSYDLGTSFGLTPNQLHTKSCIIGDGDNLVHLVHVKPRTSLYKTLDSKSLLEFKYFVTQLMYRRKWSIVEFLHKWFPDDISPNIHIRGFMKINESTTTGALTPMHILHLYLYIRGLPNYADSTFVQASRQFEEYILKLKPDLDDGC